MTDYRIFDATSGPGSQTSDTDNYTMGVEFYVTDDAWLTEIRFWASGTVTSSNHATRLYEVVSGSSGTLITDGSITLPSPLVNGWNTATLTDPVPLTINQRYRAAVYFTTDNGYTATAGYWTSGGAGASGITDGILEAPAAGSATGSSQGSFTGTDAFPNGQFGQTNYWIDVTVTDVDPSSTPGAPTVAAGADVSDHPVGSVLSRVATENDNGATITARAWKIVSGPVSAATIDTDATLAWTPTVAGTYVLSYEATNSAGTSTPDTITVEVVNPPTTPGNAGFLAGFFAG